MEAVFLQIINMSITGSYVIAAVLIARLLLSRAPKKYRYGLWTVAFFRLVCPVSFSMVFSLFHTGLFNMTRAQANGPGQLTYVPGNIATMNTPEVTVGLASVNRVINEHLPQPTPAASVNPLQVYLALAAFLWLVGIAAILIYNGIGYFLIRRRMAAAVRVQPGVYEADGVRSPFILGLFRPRIYLPFGLTGQQWDMVLCHERYHLRRGDHWIKPAAFLVRTVHWFNPLVWLAYALMVRDMEMSCDEAVLSAGGAGPKQYSQSLLCFGENHRLPGALAFGEGEISGRIKNVLRFRQPRRWVMLTAAMLTAAVLVGCAANPVSENQIMSTVPTVQPKSTAPTTQAQPTLQGLYRYDGLIYSTPVSSFLPDASYVEYYALTGQSIVITEITGSQQELALTYQQEPVNPEEFQEQFFAEFEAPDLSAYQTRLLLARSREEDGMDYRLYQMDDELWLVRYALQSGWIWSIYRIVPVEGELSFTQPMYAGDSEVAAFKALAGEVDTGFAGDVCYNVTTGQADAAGYEVFKYGSSGASFLMTQGKVYPLGEYFGGYGLTSMATGDLDGDGKAELYFTFSSGSGLHRSQAGYFQPATGQVILFPYTHQNRDMMVAGDGWGGLALYDAQANSRQNSGKGDSTQNMVDFDLVSIQRLTGIVASNGTIALEDAPGQ